MTLLHQWLWCFLLLTTNNSLVDVAVVHTDPQPTTKTNKHHYCNSSKWIFMQIYTNSILYFLPRLRAARMFKSNVWNQSPATVKEKYPLCMTAHNILLWIETRVIIKFWTYSKLALRDTSSTKCYFSSKRLWLYITLALHAQTYTKHLKRFHLQRKSQDRLGGTWGTMLIAFTF